MTLKQLAGKTIHLAKARLDIIVFGVVSLILTMVFSWLVFTGGGHPLKNNAALLTDWRWSLAVFIGITLAWSSVDMYVVVTLVAGADRATWSIQRVRYCLREFPNFIATGLLAGIRFIPSILLVIPVVIVPALVSAHVFASNPALTSLGIIPFMVLPVWWGSARLTASPFLAASTIHRYWSATRESVAVYRLNARLMFALVAPIYITMVVYVAILAFRAATLELPVSASTNATPTYTIVSSLIGFVYRLMVAAFIRETYPPDEITAV